MQTWQQVIEAIRQVQTRKGRAVFGRYAIEGTRHLERAIRAKLPLQHIVTTQTFWTSSDDRIQALRTDIEAQVIPVAIAPDESLKELVRGRKLGAIVGLAPLRQPPTLTTLMADDAQLLVLVNVVEPGNVGAMIRTAHGLGATGCVTIGSSDPFHPKAVRTAMGSLFKLPVVQFADEQEAIASLKSAGYTLYGSVSQDGVSLPAAQFPSGAKAILMGSEFYGLSAETTAQCDHLLTIPMGNSIDSFSVSAAAAILLYAVSYPTAPNQM